MADVKFQVASFTTPTVVGQTVDIEIAGFGQPKAVMFLLNGGGGNDDLIYNTGRAGWGFTDGTVNTALCCSDQNGTSSGTRTAKSVSTQYCVYLNNHLDTEDPPVVGMSFNGWLANGIQLIHGVGATARKISCILIGGADVAEVAAHTATIDYDSISGSVDVGFEPDLLFMASAYVSTLNQNNATNQLSMGVCLNDGAETQKSVSVHAQNRISTSSNNSGLSDTYISVTASNAALANPYNITGFGPTGYSWNAPSGGTGNRYAPSLAIRFTGDPDIALVNTVVPTDGNLAVSGLGFQPSFAMNLSTQNVVARDTLTNVDVFAQSTVIFDETNVRGVSWADEDSVGTSDSGGWTSDSFQSINEPSDGLLYEGPKPTFDADGWTSTLTTLPPTDVLGWALSIGAGGAAVGIQDMYVKDGGVFKQATPYIKEGGVFVAADAYVRSGGAWVKVQDK